MDPTRFDRLVRAFAGGNTRRRLVAVLTALPLAGALAGIAGDDAEAEKPRDRIKRRKDANRRSRRNRKHQRKNHGNTRKNQNQGGGGKGGEQPDACIANGGACQQHSDCCGGNCFNQVCATTVSQCGGVDCPASAAGCCTNGCCFAPANQCNAAGDCCAPDCTGKQCGPDGCGGTGACGTCTNVLQVCDEQSGQCVGGTCGPQSCPTGCCDDNDICQTGPGFGSCGPQGEASPCCAGCCDENEICQPGQDLGSCGAGGGFCRDCQAANLVCVQGECVCTADSCPDGCCDPQPGVPGSVCRVNGPVCGAGGQACVSCTAPSFCPPGRGRCCTPNVDCGDDCGTSCPAGTNCLPDENGNNGECTCLSGGACQGCCLNNVCYPGDTPQACGPVGGDCVACDSGVCIDNVCCPAGTPLICSGENTCCPDGTQSCCADQCCGSVCCEGTCCDPQFNACDPDAPDVCCVDC